MMIKYIHNVLQYCARNSLVAEGKACHAYIICSGLTHHDHDHDDVTTTTTNILINMYCKCRLFTPARLLFDLMPQPTLVSSNTLISAYSRYAHPHHAFSLFLRLHANHHPSNHFTLSSLLCACAAHSALPPSLQLHAFALKKAFLSNVYVATALLDVYSKCNLIPQATSLFHTIDHKTDVTWTSMLSGYVRNRLYHHAFALYRTAQAAALPQNHFTLSSLLSACATLAALTQGNLLHTVLHKAGFTSSIYVSSALIDMYAKCGAIPEAYAVFSHQHNHNLVSWNAMISGFSRHGQCLQVMILFEKMQQKGLLPNEVTYLSVLSACGHMGLVQEGRKYFNLMLHTHWVSPNVLHYSCLVDILGRAGLIQDAYDVLRNMPFQATASMWGSLLGACKTVGNLELAEIAAKHLFEMEPLNAGNHVLLSNIYAANKQWKQVSRSRQVLKESEAVKDRGKSWIEIKHQVHAFMVGEREHPRTPEIYSKLDELMEVMEKMGYKVETEHDVHDVDESSKAVLLRHHSEKLALAFGVMTLPPGVPIRIIKNLRICGDCHNFMKFASKITMRELIVRDVNRFHHFAKGYCSCGDFW